MSFITAGKMNTVVLIKEVNYFFLQTLSLMSLNYCGYNAAALSAYTVLVTELVLHAAQRT